MLSIEEIGKNIRELRTRAGLSQEDLGKVLGHSHAAISYIEKGKTEITLKDLFIIANTLKITVAELLDIKSIPSNFTMTLNFRGSISHQIIRNGYNLKIASNEENTSNTKAREMNQTTTQTHLLK
jgi:transcriptional regulator with XRE-family HTH domain